MGEVPRFPRQRRWLVLAGLALGLSTCGSSSEMPYEVTRAVVSNETTQEILVFAPDEEEGGAWPVVIALHGRDGSAEHMAETSLRLAERGMVVFAVNYRTDLTSEEGAIQMYEDLICGASFAGSIAGDHGGDPSAPLTLLGWSLGAGHVLSGGLSEELDPEGLLTACTTETPAVDVVVAVAGCHYGFGDAEFDFDVSGWANKDATVVIGVGEDDTVCPPWQSEDAADELRSNGYDVDFVVFDDADHFSPFYLDFVDGEVVPDADHPAGDHLVDVVADAVNAAADA